MRNRVLSIEQARSQYLKTIAEAKLSNTNRERERSSQEVKQAVKNLQQAQMTSRLQKSRRASINRPSDWNIENQ